ncbi:NAD(P)/FAD-dependent oxidoreductase [Arvimicrobium flavum]|uniref:NAD(P)/FAD-dependent oxidoreductase n=1 Tax=Arvimicrobium flavum TaxID=3393320 RepID=UPI00237BE07E|nr:FAD-binding oxidoreductase [Mesorhizobium shangrilense]
MTDEIHVDVAIIGAGIAGAGIAAEIAAELSCAILEQEERPGYHSTGRSAAIFLRNYGNDVIRALTQASAAHYDARDRSLFPSPLLTPRGALFVTDAEGQEALADLLAQSNGLREIGVEDAITRVPILNRDWLAAAAFEEDAQDIDVAALHEGWLKKARANGAQLVTRAPVARAERRDGAWHIETPSVRVRAATIVNAAGAWADKVAAACGVTSIGLQPMRRSMAVLPAPEGYDLKDWPLIDDARENWYCKPDGGRLFVSPGDEDPVDPHDAFADDMVLAEGLYRFEQAVTIPVTRVERSWAGLRTFAPDRTPVTGFDRTTENFFWLAGQGGYGIQTGPALSRLAGELLRGVAPSAGMEAWTAALSPNRFR